MNRIALCGLGVAAALAVATPAFGHADVDTPTPAATTSLRACPSEVQLHFTEGVAVNGLTVSAAGHPLVVTATDPTRWVVTTAGVCSASGLDLVWKSTSADDGHVADGQLHFTIASVVAAKALSPSGPSAGALGVLGAGGLVLLAVAATSLRRKAPR